MPNCCCVFNISPRISALFIHFDLSGVIMSVSLHACWSPPPPDLDWHPPPHTHTIVGAHFWELGERKKELVDTLWAPTAEPASQVSYIEEQLKRL